MSNNHLEQLVCEWYEVQGYFVRRNVLVGKRSAGGHETELDVVAFHPERKHLVHIEPSLDTDSWAQRESRYTKKFLAGKKYIPSMFPNLGIPKDIEQIALFLYGSGTTHPTLGGGRLMLVSDLMADIMKYLLDHSVKKNMVSEQFPLIRTLLYASEFRKNIAPIWFPASNA
ncbi:hypothetical protein [Geothrix sp.]|jgi:hypothetical protein|uniref:hypothetical protein n=1 Tax=Geothrix sp. TaxID=1962974 RepID=UPI0025B9F700|nr:hypothetical protein [Geothrix sp.]